MGQSVFQPVAVTQPESFIRRAYILKSFIGMYFLIVYLDGQSMAGMLALLTDYGKSVAVRGDQLTLNTLLFYSSSGAIGVYYCEIPSCLTDHIQH